jgi:hypothetical protein
MMCFAMVWSVLWLCPPNPDAEGPRIVDVHVDKEYRTALLANEWLMQEGGVDTVRVHDGIDVLVGVGQVMLEADATPAEALSARRAAETKATRVVSEFLRTDISTVSTLVRSVVKHSEGVEGTSKRIEKYLGTHVQQRSKLAARIKRVGYWSSADGRCVFVAVAVVPIK